MLCERCSERRATVHVQTVEQMVGDDSGLPWWGVLSRVVRGFPARGSVVDTTHLCKTCSVIPARFDPEQGRRVLELEASGRKMPHDWFRDVAKVFRQRSDYHHEPLSADIEAFISRHTSFPERSNAG